MNWARERRLDFIEGKLDRHRFLRRTDIMGFFDISMPQASLDIQAYLALNPNVGYDKSLKGYFPSDGFKPVRGMTERKWNALRELA